MSAPNIPTDEPLIFCTLFDSNYLTRGLAMYESLRRHCKSFHLYIFPFDARALDILQSLNLEQVTIIPLSRFEDANLLSVKPTRSRAEYCWTATSSTILYVLEHFPVTHCTYLDSDLYFYGPPEELTKEIGESSIVITEHRYTPRYDLSALSGIYCVQYILFRNDKRGLEALRWWRSACIDWCFAKEEDGKFGDQKYLDDWPRRFKGVHVLSHTGGGLAPWNIQQYRFEIDGTSIKGTVLATGMEFQPMFYHFHYVRFHSNGRVDLGDYELSERVKSIFYVPYLRHLEVIRQSLGREFADTIGHGARPIWTDWRRPLLNVRRRFRGQYNIHRLSQLLNTR